MAKIAVFTKDTDQALATQLKPVVYLPKIAAPYTTVVKRAQCTDFSNDLLPRFGIERVMTQAIQEVQGESGPNGERVFKPVNDQHDAVRFVGLITDGNDSQGSRVNIQAGSYAEYTFYGTGLNLLLYTDGSTRSMSVSVDGGSATTVTNSGSTVLNGRNYAQNGVINVSSGLALGIHTVKVAYVGADILVYGYEVLNTNSTLQQTAGTSYLGGKRLYAPGLTTSNPTSGFTNTYGTAGTRGGHVLVYQKADGTVAKDIRYTETTAAYLSSASHANEEVIRTYSWREFGAGRSDDFSTLGASGSARAFTLDDGTTTLVGSTVAVLGSSQEYLTIQANAAFITLTFVGTGLDFLRIDQTGTLDQHTLYIDGTSQGTITGTGNTTNRIQKVASGLPYGTHTFKMTRDAFANSAVGISQFIVYGPSKPTLPTDCVELADYYVMADYAASTVATREFMPTGTLRKFLAVREAVYAGTWSAGSVNVANYESGFGTQSGASASSVSYTFFGTGFEWSQFVFTNAMSATYTLDGATNFTVSNSSPTGGAGWTGALTTQLLQTSSGLSFTASTGVLSGTSAGTGRLRLRVTGLTLGFHTIKFTTGNANQHYSEALDIITPIHAPKGNLPGDIQNTSSVGSCAISDNRKFSATSVKPLVNWAQAIGVTTTPTTTSTTAVPMTDMSVTLKTAGNPIQISYAVTVRNNTAAGNTVAINVYVDGVFVGTQKYMDTPVAGYSETISDCFIVPVAAGTHKVDLYWYTNAGTAASPATQRSLIVVEI
jgi:hypothetical protein